MIRHLHRSGLGESLSGEARLFRAGFGVDGFDLLIPKRLARSGMSLSIGKSIHDRKGRMGCKPNWLRMQTHIS